jgi:AcrR family transcriptional regulator|tara:strand:- start:2371 stop:2661 length:291 start_codon:yes stop_codon:yes gene_type:complete
MGRSNPKIWRGRPKQKRTENTVSVILLSAQDILASEGCHRTMTEEIARYAGVGIGSIYDYFPNKIAMALALLEQTELDASESSKKYLTEHNSGRVE